MRHCRLMSPGNWAPGARGLLAGALLACAGCCSPPPPSAEKFFERQSPLETLRGFVYAVDTHQWDYAYNCLTPASQKEIGRLKFEAAIRWASDPVLHEIPIYSVISASVLYRGQMEREGSRARILVSPKVRDSNNVPVAFPATLYFELDAAAADERWLFDFLGTVNALTQGELRADGAGANIPGPG